MDVTDVLAGEHGVFHLLVEQLDDAIDRCQTLGELRVAVEPLALSLLGHARVEEDTLFRSYEQATGTLGPLRCLRHEHEQMDRWIRALTSPIPTPLSHPWQPPSGMIGKPPWT